MGKVIKFPSEEVRYKIRLKKYGVTEEIVSEMWGHYGEDPSKIQRFKDWFNAVLKDKEMF